MSRKKRGRQPARDAPEQRNSPTVGFLLGSGEGEITCSGYTSLAHNPEIVTAVNTIAKLVGSMTIQLMVNTPDGDIRVRNELARKVDINPTPYMTRANWMQWIVKTMLLDGNGNAVVYPRTRRGILRELIPVPPAYVSYIQDGWGYRLILGGREYDPDDLLHFVANPGDLYPWWGTGYRVALRDVANNLKQAAATEKGFMSSKWKPSIIVKVDSLVEEFSSPEGRQKLLEDYVMSAEAGGPWLIPAQQFQVEQVKPLTLSDLALADFVKLDKATVASILGVPPFVLGVGEFKRDAWNSFIDTTLMPIAKGIEQELTRKLLYKPEWYFRFNARSLYSYSITEMVQAGKEMVDRMAMRRNEWRAWVNLPPDAEMDELLALENYLPITQLGNQKKLVQNGGDST